MPVRPCLQCGALSPASYCPRHTPDRGNNPKRGNGWQRTKWRTAVLAVTNGACARCGSRDRVQAHHLRALAHGGAGDGPGFALCHTCHGRA